MFAVCSAEGIKHKQLAKASSGTKQGTISDAKSPHLECKTGPKATGKVICPASSTMHTSKTRPFSKQWLTPSAVHATCSYRSNTCIQIRCMTSDGRHQSMCASSDWPRHMLPCGTGKLPASVLLIKEHLMCCLTRQQQNGNAHVHD